MITDEAIKVELVSKKYCKFLKRSMLYGLKDIGRNMLGLSSHSETLRKSEFWAVNNISFEMKKGETLGIIGSNGSGKTTILKMLNGIFWPDTGKITIRGKVGALIEVGAGFHPLLTGRENIYVNAAILGMRKEEVDEKFNDIIEFAEIGDFIDVPVKFYSSGMFVRLGFSVAAHCNPDILLVDEVLAVGDLAFILKCNRRLSKFRQDGGTLLMVSHNIQAVRNMCKKALWIDKGKAQVIGEVNKVCDLYEEDVLKNKRNPSRGKKFVHDSKARISKVEFLNNNNQICSKYKVGSYFKIRIHFRCNRIVEKPIFTISFFNIDGILVSSNYSDRDGFKIDTISKIGYIDYCLNRIPLNPSKYNCSITFSEHEVSNVLDWYENYYNFIVAGNSSNYGMINPFPKWTLKK